MCGRFTQYHSEEELLDRFEALRTPDLKEPLEPRYNIAPSQKVAAVIAREGRRLEQFQWGLLPAWAKDVRKPLINIRADTLAEKPYFRGALARRRCLIPASGFYEWKEADTPQEGGKTPIYFHRPDGKPLGFAGIWEQHGGAAGVPQITCAIITTEPNSLLGRVHNRMPMLLPQSAVDLWLGASVTDAADLLPLLTPCAEELEAYPVSRLVNAPAHDTEQCIVPTGEKLRVEE